jgi:hypothetical protein
METSASFEARSAPSSYPTEGDGMSFGHERLDGHQAALENVGPAAYAAVGIDPDADTDSDPERGEMPTVSSGRRKARR